MEFEVYTMRRSEEYEKNMDRSHDYVYFINRLWK